MNIPILSNLKISTQLVIMMMLVSIIIVTIIGTARTIWETEQATQSIIQNLTSTTNLVSSHLEAALSFNDTRLADNYLTALKNISGVRFSCVYRKDGSVFSSFTQRTESHASCPVYDSVQHNSVNVGTDAILVSRYIYQGQSTIGSILVNSDLSLVDKIRNEQVVFSLWALGFAVIFVFVISLWVQRLVSRRILTITETANAITTEDNDDIRVNINGNDEIGQLAKSFNFMLDSLERNQREQREILNSMLDGVVTIDEDGVIQSFNHAAERIFGYEEEDLVGENIGVLMTDPLAESHNDYIKNYCLTGRSHIIGTSRVVDAKRKNGEMFPLNLSIAELPETTDSKHRFIGSCIDLTKEKQQEEQLRRIQKMQAIGQLTGGVAHDYNNMLSIVLGYTGLLKEHLRKDEQLINYINQVEHAAERGVKLTKRLLSFSKSDTGEPESLDINNVLSESEQMLSKLLTSRIRLEIFHKSSWPIYVDSSELEDVIVNMCINAMHAIDKSGRITITTCDVHLDLFESERIHVQEGDYVSLTIHDTGKGMDNETRDKIFEPFFSTKGDKGTGLGLSMVYGFIERSGGNITVTSKPGFGTKFTLYFPRKDKSAQDNSQNELKQKDHSGNEVILVVDDEQALLSLMENLLKPYGYRVYTAINAHEAISIVDKNSIDLVISDVVMPDMSGYDLAEYLKRQHPDIKIQLVSGYQHADNSAVVDDDLKQKTISKPYKTSELLNSINTLLH